MDIAYDRIQEEALVPEEGPAKEEVGPEHKRAASNDLNTELREAYQALSDTSWGAKLGGFFGTVKKQGESYYEGARNELSAASTEATKGINDLITQAGSIALNPASVITGSSSESAGAAKSVDPEKPEDSLSADIAAEAEHILKMFRSEASVRVKQIQKAEEAADDALLKFGTNIRNFLRDAVTIAPPTDYDDPSIKRSVLFESKDADGKRIVHATRFDAQLHVIHSTAASFTEDPPSDEYAKWKESFDVGEKTDAIAQDLDKYRELRTAMEKSVPEKVEYAQFWTRYYFLRHVIETEEQKRRELLKGTQTEEEEVGWGDDDEEEGTITPSKTEDKPTPKIHTSDETPVPSKDEEVNTPRVPSSTDLLKPAEGRKSNEHSVADSDASYDIVSGAASRAPGSPKDDKEADRKKTTPVAEESDEDDWE